MRSRRFAIFAAGFIGLFLTACATAMAGGAAAAAYAYHHGWLTRDYDASLDQVCQASLAALKKDNIHVVEKMQRPGFAEIEAAAQDQTYWVRLENGGGKLTEVSVRAGFLGYRPAARKIQSDIQANL